MLRLRLVSPAFGSKTNHKNWLFCCFNNGGDRARPSCCAATHLAGPSPPPPPPLLLLRLRLRCCYCAAAAVLLLCCCLSDGVVLDLPLSLSLGAAAPCFDSNLMLPPRSPSLIWRPCTPFLRLFHRKHNQNHARVNQAFF